ncbi:MAG: glycosyl hydrolase family 8 [Myxococcota bacterium]
MNSTQAQSVCATSAVALVGMISTAHAHPPDLQANLERSWTQYITTFIQDDGRVIDRGAGDISTSEGQAYAMLRAAWSDDRATFERVRGWSIRNLQRGKSSNLPAWRWGQRPDGKWGTLDGQPASDSDQLMAFALLIAAERWSEPTYRTDAVALLHTIWDQETRVVGGRRMILAGPWAMEQDPVQVNPSYLMPFAYRAFAKADAEHDWNSLVDSSYDLLERTTTAYGLPPDWAWVDATTGEIVAPPGSQTHMLSFGYDAFRAPWNLAAEVQWHDETRARVLLARMSPLGTMWRRDGRLPAKIAPGGEAAAEHDYLGMYGALLPAWHHSRPGDAHTLYKTQIEPSDSLGVWGRPDDYYAQNWVWFGLALWTGLATPPEVL